jgi:hypothetical protein
MHFQARRKNQERDLQRSEASHVLPIRYSVAINNANGKLGASLKSKEQSEVPAYADSTDANSSFAARIAPGGNSNTLVFSMNAPKRHRPHLLIQPELLRRSATQEASETSEVAWHLSDATGRNTRFGET